jgi:hypothetical protein
LFQFFYLNGLESRKFYINLQTTTIDGVIGDKNEILANMEDNNKEQQSLQLELPQNVAQGEYANYAIITHSSSDFVIDFARVLPGVPKAPVKSRVILAPEHAKRLLVALQENIIRYEKEYGPIRIPSQQEPISPFDLPQGEA